MGGLLLLQLSLQATHTQGKGKEGRGFLGGSTGVGTGSGKLDSSSAVCHPWTRVF